MPPGAMGDSAVGESKQKHLGPLRESSQRNLGGENANAYGVRVCLGSAELCRS